MFFISECKDTCFQWIIEIFLHFFLIFIFFVACLEAFCVPLPPKLGVNKGITKWGQPCFSLRKFRADFLVQL